MQDSKRQQRRQQDKKILTILFSILFSALLLYGVLLVRENKLSLQLSWPWQKTSIYDVAKFKSGAQVLLLTGDESDRIGIIDAPNEKMSEEGEITYNIKLSSEEYLENIPESALELHETLYKIGDSVEITDGTTISKRIDSISLEDGTYLYTLFDESMGTYSAVLEQDIVTIIDVLLEEENTASENNRLIQEALDQSKNYRQSILNFPEGKFKIGSYDESDDYILLASNVELRGNRTKFVVTGASRWLGLATGPDTADGVSNVFMYGFFFEASDLVNGDQFVLMLNHGRNWKIFNNSFTMVHATGSHIFDFGGVIEFEVTNNQFIGYAPELTGVSEIGDRELHDFYSEAIQLDASSTAAWDGNTISRIDPNFERHNQIKHLSSYVTIAYNDFLPYLNPDGQVIAYSATVGQHSTEVGPGVSIQHNRLLSQLVERYQVDDMEKHWYFTPVHAVSHSDVILEPNTIE